jgi:hypothetical protein
MVCALACECLEDIPVTFRLFPAKLSWRSEQERDCYTALGQPLLWSNTDGVKDTIINNSYYSMMAFGSEPVTVKETTYLAFIIKSVANIKHGTTELSA